ncbi:MAG TPA: ATP-binding protein [Candidatus Sericytochromatia bacterium]|jgi:energy-coupling factor transporter ATP-binding protein EcfA2
MTELHPSQFEERAHINRQTALTSWGIAAAAAGCLALGAIPDRLPAWRLPFTGVAWALTLLAKPLRKLVIDSERRANDGRDISQKAWQDWLLASMKPTAKAAIAEVAATEAEAVAPYDWTQLKDESNHILLMGPSGSGKDTSARMISTMYGNDHQILVIDTHNLKNPWKPLTVVDTTVAVFAQLELLLTELKERRTEGRKGLPPRPPLFIIINEWLALTLQAKSRKLDICERFIRVMLIEARKYDIVFLFMGQAESAEAMGLEGFAGLKDAFKSIRLVKACRRYMETSSDKALRAYVMADKGWTCMVDDEIAHHLTHYHHHRFGKKLPPVPIPPLHSLPLSIAVAVAVDDGTDDGTYEVIKPTPADAHTPPHLTTAPNRTFTAPDTAPNETPLDDRTRLERLWQSDFNPTAPDTAPFSDAPLDDSDGEDEPGCGQENDEIDGLHDEYLRALIFQCVSEGITNEADQIKQIWGIAKSGENPRYRKATKRLRAVKAKYGL